MRTNLLRHFLLCTVLCGAGQAWSQVSPAEIRNPELKSLEQSYMKQLVALNREIAHATFPFTVTLNRYVGQDPRDGGDTRGLEFVRYHERTILKVSANYSAAFRSESMTQNQRANRLLDEVVVPILRLLPQYFEGDVPFEGFGFEISYHVRTGAVRADSYEGKEILVAVFAKTDAAAYPKAATEARQQILNASEIYVSGRAFAVALGKPEPLDIEEIQRARTAKESPAPSSAGTFDSSAVAKMNLGGGQRSAMIPASGLGSRSLPVPIGPDSRMTAAAPAALTQADADALQQQHQPELDALMKYGVERFHFAGYAPPSLAVFRNRLYLQVTLRNPAVFDQANTAIYKRAAQSFDLFLAPLLKDLLSKTPAWDTLAGLDITVLVQFSASSFSSEAVEYICPLDQLRRFTDYEITNQELLNQSVILVNGVRIALNLQQVE
jgi:hypothetical protein